jgi:hypothetical protein
MYRGKSRVSRQSHQKSYACFFSLTVAPDAYYMVSVVVPTANLERCEPVVAEIQDAIKLP